MRQMMKEMPKEHKQLGLGTTASVSDLKLAANKANALVSTGPVTPEGKAASSQNNFKHGLYSKQLIMKGENSAELDALKADLITEHQPANTTEDLLVNEMAEQYWRLKRARRIEASIFSADSLVIPHMNAVQRLMSSAERGFHKALKTLGELQKSAAKRCLAGDSGEGATPPRSALPASPQNQRGFVPQKREAAATLVPVQPAKASTAAVGIGFESQKAVAVPSLTTELAALEKEFEAIEKLLKVA
jgi:hypothetical protein